MKGDQHAIRVLLIDDERDDYEVTRGILSRSHPSRYELTWKASYEEGLEALLTLQFDVCLLDYRLGARDGLELLTEAVERGTRVPTVFLTGLSDPGVERTALTRGAADYLDKNSLDSSSLERAIRHSLDRSRRLDELRDREKRFRSVFEGALDAMLLVDDDARYIDGNGAALDLLGVTREQLLTRTIRDITPKDKGSEFDAAWRAFREQGRLEGEFSLRRANGEERTVYFRANADISPGCHLSVLHDITDRKAAERHRGRLAAMVESAADAIGGLTLDGVIDYWSPAAERLYGHTAEEALGQSKQILVLPAEVPVLVEMLANVRSGRAVRDKEMAHRRKDGGTFAASVTMSPVVEEGRIVAASMTVRDISEKKQLEAQLALSERLASMGTLAAGVAHEINNPLAALMTNLQFALEPLSGGSASTVHESDADRIRLALLDACAAAERIAHVVRDLRLYSKAEDARRGPVDLRQVLEASLRMAWNEVRHRARVVKDYQDVAPVEGNEAKLGQVFLNIIVNAAQAIREGDVEGNEIRITTRSEGDQVVVEVSDTGRGIPEAARSRLFDPFFTTKPSAIGTGLGLSICRRIVTEHGGTVTASDNVSRGTTFRVAFPASQAAQARAPKVSAVEGSKPAAPMDRTGVRILLIDDDEHLMRALSQLLERRYDLTVAASGAEALAVLESQPPFDVIFCDMMMPQMTGMEFHHALAQRSPEDAQRVVFLTGGAFTPDARRFLERFPDRHLEKPFDLPSLESYIAERLRGERQRDERTRELRSSSR